MSMSLMGLPSDPGVIGDPFDIAQQSKFPHTRALLSTIVRRYKPADNGDSDAEVEDFIRIPTSMVNKVVGMLVSEQEDELKLFLKSSYGISDETAEQHVLDLMHKHRDDIAGVPFLFLTPTRRPISRPSSRASTHSARLVPPGPESPSAPGSPLAHIFRRPHTPLGSPLVLGGGNSYMTAKSEYSYSTSPTSSPILAHAITTNAQYTASLPSSPLSSPRLLSAKASEFKPIPRPLSAAAFNPAPRRDTPSPDLWSHGSPFRASSNLAIAAPLLPDTSISRSPSLPSPLHATAHDDYSDEDPFDPFAQSNKTNGNGSQLFSGVPDLSWSNSSSNSSRSPEHDVQPHYYTMPFESPNHTPPDDDDTQAAVLTDGMTPFDVLSSVFGSTLAPSELEEALAANGYDFERAMAWLIDRATPVTPPGQVQVQTLGGRVTIVSPGAGRGGRGGYVSPPVRGGQRPANGRQGPGGNRVCRYFIAGECLRADCRFSHDLERALCRFWLRGTCAKQENCEFLHHLPENADISGLSIAMARANVAPGTGPLANHMPANNSAPPVDDFPVLGFDGGKSRRPYTDRPYNDPSRTRFAAAVKKPAAPLAMSPEEIARREAMGPSADSLYHRSAIVAPRPSPRLRLRPPSLLPTLATGESINNMYMSYRSRALQLGSARNACLSRAADAWRRGDGAGAKRFSRDGHDLNVKMAAEMNAAASNLVRERTNLAEQAVRARDPNWSDDPADRTTRGMTCGGGLGIMLGIAPKSIGDGKLTSEERAEGILDLHGLHSNEATEVLEEFLMALEREHFYGLAYIIVGEEKHTGTQDAGRGASRARLATGVREWVHRWGYPWSEREGIICIDPLTHASE